jgi:hypothetical protein
MCLRFIVVASVLALFTVPGAAAQGIDSTATAVDSSHTAEVKAAGPTVAASSVAVRAVSRVPETRAGVEDALRLQQRAGRGNSVALMIVGGAALVTGLIIGDDAGALLAVGGAVVGLYGLYQYVR